MTCPHLVVVDPMWFDESLRAPRTSVRAHGALLERRRRRLAAIARASVLATRDASKDRGIARIFRSLSSELDDESIDSSGITVLPSVGALVVDDTIASLLRRSALLGLHLVGDGPWSVSGPFDDLPSNRTPERAWHVAAVRGDARDDACGEGVVVGVLDTGVDASHPEIAHVPLHFRAFSNDGSPLDSAPRDFGIHGTHVVGTIAGATCGIAPRATVAVAAVMTPTGSAASFAAGLDWLISGSFGRARGRAGVDVINASIGFAGADPMLRILIRRALRECGILTIAAAGNDGAGGPGCVSVPAAFPETLAVGAVDRRGVVAPFSAYGDVRGARGKRIAKPELAAPGVDIRSCIPGGRFRELSATSMACPVVTGTAAVLLARHPHLRNKPRSLRRALLDASLTPIAPHPRYGNTGGVGSVRL